MRCFHTSTDEEIQSGRVTDVYFDRTVRILHDTRERANLEDREPSSHARFEFVGLRQREFELTLPDVEIRLHGAIETFAQVETYRIGTGR